MVLLYLNVVFFSFFLKKFRLNSPLPSAMYIFFFFFMPFIKASHAWPNL